MTDMQEQVLPNEEDISEPVGDNQPEPDYGDDGADEFDSQPEPQQPEEDPAVVAQAKALGWKPPEDWKGDTTNYMSAEKYLEIQQRRLSRVEQQDEELKSLRKELIRLQREAQDRFKRADESNLQYLREEQRRAAELGDMKRFDALSKQIDEASKPRQFEEPDEAPEAVYQRAIEEATADPVYQQWNSQHTWYNGQSLQDQAKTMLANRIAQNSGINPMALPPQQRREFYDNIARQVAEAYGEKANPMGSYSAPNGRSPARSPGRKAKDFDSLPVEAKTTGWQQMQRLRAYPNTDKGRAEYARDVWAEINKADR